MLKKIILGVFLVSNIILLTSCSSSSPENLGGKIYSILEALRDNDKESFLDELVSPREMQGFIINHPYLSRKEKRILSSYTKSFLHRNFRAARRIIRNKGIDVDDISNLEYEYIIIHDLPHITTCFGLLQFECHNHFYGLGVVFIDMDGEFRALRVKNLYYGTALLRLENEYSFIKGGSVTCFGNVLLIIFLIVVLTGGGCIFFQREILLLFKLPME